MQASVSCRQSREAQSPGQSHLSLERLGTPLLPYSALDFMEIKILAQVRTTIKINTIKSLSWG
ncbi:hypothetical protein NITUZ_40346 [Candidatus Nitrosotenuis uzonensis]|uniref:Uncharacterized protein n=1 Tax=Candidatus Nitrosotenuis uzonensis TaxID=1407055 RepID=V6AUJ7_9ARCH|nr:hypothetical protein NITUZ_40346 [Candidatus Nitrosotenuis uzonensis]